MDISNAASAHWDVTQDSQDPIISNGNGIQLIAHGASLEKAKEIAAALNPIEGYAQGGFLSSDYTIAHRVGEYDVVYAAPTAEEVVWMAKQGEQQVEGTPNITLNIVGKPASVGTNQDGCAEEANSAMTVEERIRSLTAERDLFCQAAKAEYENAARYKGYLDRCGVAIGVEAFTSDDGSIQDRPHPSKVPEMVEAIIAASLRPEVPVAFVMEARSGERGFSWDEGDANFSRAVWERRPVFYASDVPANVDSLIAGALFDFLGGLTTRDKTLKLGTKHEVYSAVDALEAFANSRGLKLDAARVQSWINSLPRSAATTA